MILKGADNKNQRTRRTAPKVAMPARRAVSPMRSEPWRRSAANEVLSAAGMPVRAGA